jgi:FixJ family two-component response regulator
MQAGAVAFLGKPFSDGLLLETIRASLEAEESGEKAM